ncbi:MAG: hypothetical protein L3J44_00480 [Campylobacteraceae bacterium]|nr:hypothetical protein [Campylobacteraceae bacterium]
MKYSNEIIKNVIKKNQIKREVSQLSIKIDKRLNIALQNLSSKLNISKNRLIEDILYESGIIEEVGERLL